MTQFEVMVHLVGIKTKEGEDFVKVVKEVEKGRSWWVFKVILENGSFVRSSSTSLWYNTGSSYSALNEKRFCFAFLTPTLL